MTNRQTANPGRLLLHLTTPLILISSIVIGVLAALLYELDASLVWDWLLREGDVVLVWWLLTTFAGAAVMPIFFQLLPGLPSRGYALARSGGVMLTGFVFWFGATLFNIQNTPGAIVIAWLLVILIAGAVWRLGGERPELGTWFKHHWTFIVVVEIIFIALLLGWAVIRAHEPEVRSTEKPMEMMFVNSIRHSETFPPNDGWLAGYSISYYYFGYVITAALADLSGANTGIAFGLIGPMLLALTGIGVLGLVYDLVRLRWGQSGRHGAIWVGILGLMLLLFMGNLGTFFVEQPWNGRGAAGRLASPDYFEFWGVPERSRLALQNEQGSWDIPGENRTQAEPPGSEYVIVRDGNMNGIPDWDEDPRDFENWDNWWWFRYSRVVEDQFLDGRPIGIQPIAEVPHFSFILGDIHPHVLSLPFTILAITLAAGLALGGRPLSWWGYGLYAVWVGGMIFMNSWDAVFIPFVIAAEALRRLIHNKTGRLTLDDLMRVAGFGVALVGLTALLYLPWIISFTSQAGGIYFNLIWPTASQQFFLQFGAFGILLGPFLLVSAWRARQQLPWRRMVITFVVLFLLIIVAFPFLMTGVYHGLCELSDNPVSSVCTARGIILGGSSPARDGFWGDLLLRRMSGYVSEGLVLAGLVFIGYYLFRKPQDHTQDKLPFHSASGFALLVLAAGLVLVILPDFVYLIDNFRVRINTVFKLYYQGWIFLSVAAAYGIYGTLNGLTAVLITRPADTGPVLYPPPVNWRFVYVMIVAVVLAMGLIYPANAMRSRALVETGRLGSADDADLTLDGRRTAVSADEFAVAQCLLDLDPAPDAILAEAPGVNAYNSSNSRLSMLTGVPTLLGWINHEGQWRGATYDRVTEVVRDANGAVIDSRQIQIDTLYNSDDWSAAQAVIDRYEIDYVMVGEAERRLYADSPDGLDKFADNLEPVCAFGSVVLYQVGG